MTLFGAPLAAEAQQAGKVHRVGFVMSSAHTSDLAGPDPAPYVRAFVHAMRDLGYVEGQNLVLERRSAGARFERAPEIIAELVGLKVDVIVTGGNPVARAAKAVTTSAPIVMATSSDPVEAGLVASLARSGSNVTGLTLDSGPEINGKRLELLKETVPNISRVAVIGSKEDWESPKGKNTQAAARALGLTLHLAEHKANDYAPAFALVTRERADAIFASLSGPNYANRRLIIEFAGKRHLPASYAFRESVEDGGLMSYGPSVVDLFRRAATYVDKILKGAKPGDLPVEQPTKFELVINLKTAKALGLKIPQSVLIRADAVIQ
ncbi:MAG: ABC transporter substrate-binding protein [Candidatus Methylomirabilota bacterium]